MKIYIVRHGQTMFNLRGRVQGWCDSPLTEEGIQQAKSLQPFFANIPLCAGYHSGSERALDTLENILAGKDIPLYRDKRLKEVYFGDLEGEIVKRIFPDGEVKFGTFYEHGGELRSDAAKRFLEACQEIEKKENGDVLIVSHGSVIREFMEEYSSEFHERALAQNVTRALVPNCSVSVVEIQKGQVRVLEMPHTVV